MNWEVGQPTGWQAPGWQPGEDGETPPPAYPSVVSSIRLPGAGVWVVNPTIDSSSFCEIDWSGVLPADVTLVSVAYNFPEGITGVTAAVDTGAGKSAVAMDGVVHASMRHILVLATLSDGSQLGCTAPLRGFNG